MEDLLGRDPRILGAGPFGGLPEHVRKSACDLIKKNKLRYDYRSVISQEDRDNIPELQKAMKYAHRQAILEARKSLDKGFLEGFDLWKRAGKVLFPFVNCMEERRAQVGQLAVALVDPTTREEVARSHNAISKFEKRGYSDSEMEKCGMKPFVEEEE